MFSLSAAEIVLMQLFFFLQRQHLVELAERQAGTLVQLAAIEGT